jgi:hypothetical protein
MNAALLAARATGNSHEERDAGQEADKSPNGQKPAEVRANR